MSVLIGGLYRNKGMRNEQAKGAIVWAGLNGGKVVKESDGGWVQLGLSLSWTVHDARLSPAYEPLITVSYEIIEDGT